MLRYLYSDTPMAKIKRIKVQSKLYKCFISKINNIEQIRRMHEFINEDKLVKILINNGKLYRNSPYNKIAKQDVEGKNKKVM